MEPINLILFFQVFYVKPIRTSWHEVLKVQGEARSSPLIVWIWMPWNSHFQPPSKNMHTWIASSQYAGLNARQSNILHKSIDTSTVSSPGKGYNAWQFNTWYQVIDSLWGWIWTSPAMCPTCVLTLSWFELVRMMQKVAKKCEDAGLDRSFFKKCQLSS
jgi:hypothetical protein